MSHSASTITAAKDNRTMLLVLGLVAAISGLLISLAYEYTKAPIARYQREEQEQAVLRVLPQGVTSRPYIALPDRVVPGEGPVEGGFLFYAAFDAAGTLVGIAGTGSGAGYADQIILLWGYDPRCACIIGVQTLQNKDTPGFGDRAEKETDFRANFNQLDVRLNAEATAPANPIKLVKHGTKTEAWQIDAISGATVTSRGYTRALRSSTEALLPRVVKHLSQLKPND